MKITFGRKFLGCVIATVILCGMFFTTLFKNPAAVTPAVMTIYGGFIMFVWIGYIGGNMFSKWVIANHYVPELVGK